MFARVYESLLDALAVAFPVECAGCGSPDRALCVECRASLGGAAHRQRLADGTPVASALRYEGVARTVILDFKERGRTDLARPLSRALRLAVESAAAGSPAPVEVCPIPSTRSARRRRGYRPVEVLLRGCRFRAAHVLALAAVTTQQKSLGRTGREENLHGSLRARFPLHGRRFIIVDDIMTTGATVSEAARAIRAHGGEVVAIATLAFTPKHVSFNRSLIEQSTD